MGSLTSYLEKARAAGFLLLCVGTESMLVFSLVPRKGGGWGKEDGRWEE